MDLPYLPGGDGFIDVTQIFLNAAADMEPGSTLLMEDFTLQDAMSAFEIGEPRLDSGIILEEETRPPFDPLTPLLPEEICWILDRSFACEMEWHAGHTLAQTVFSLLHVHRLAEIEPDLLPTPSTDDQSRPLELITLVLRAGVFGLLKSCDLAWKKLSKGGVQDGEDWQAEKCEISILESVPTGQVINIIDDTVAWLTDSPKVRDPWKQPLLTRLRLRKVLLQLLHLDIYDERTEFIDLLDITGKLLIEVRRCPAPEPAPGSTASFTLDPFLARRLNTFVPMRAVEIASNDITWERMDYMLNAWRELSVLCITPVVATWEIAGNHQLWVTSKYPPTAYIRACTQLAFDDGTLILNKFTSAWIVDRFFVETIDVSYDAVMEATVALWTRSNAPPFTNIARLLTKLLTNHMRALWLNPPRRRRHLMKSLVDWHILIDYMIYLCAGIGPDSTDNMAANPLLRNLHLTASLRRLTAVREVIFSGFQLELYNPDERAFAYWYATQVLEEHLSCLDRLMSMVTKDSLPYQEMQFQHGLLTALQLMSMATFTVSVKLISFSWQQMKTNFVRRYKWAFVEAYMDIETPMAVPPTFHGFLVGCEKCAKNQDFSPSDSFKFAQSILDSLVTQQLAVGGWAGKWGHVRTTFVKGLIDVCERLCSLPTSTLLAEFDEGLLKWDPQIHPWFPIISEEGANRRGNNRNRTNL